MATLPVYKGHDNKVSVRVYVDRNPYNMSQANRFTLHFKGTDITLDSDIDDFIQWDHTTTGELIFFLKDLSLEQGLYLTRLTVYDDHHPQGQVLSNYTDTLLEFKFIDPEPA